MRNKKALSNVISVVSLILLTLVSVGIIASYIIPLVRDNLNESGECLNYRDYLSFRDDFGYNCEKDGLYAISIGASSLSEDAQEEIKGFVLVFVEETGDSISVEVSNGSDDFGMNEEMIRRINSSLSLEAPKSGEIRTYVYNSSKRFISVEIYPKLNSGRLCPMTDSVRIEDVICTNILTLQ